MTNMIPAEKLLNKIVDSVNGTARNGQITMTNSSEKAIKEGKNIIVTAGTGIGKSFAYISSSLTAAAEDEVHQPIVIVTATKALQEQLVLKDLPIVSAAYQELYGRELKFTKALGVNNFLCNLQLKETNEKLMKGTLTENEQIVELKTWSQETLEGDKAELDFEPTIQNWSQFSVSSGECLGKKKCPESEKCFALRAKAEYPTMDIIVANAALYAVYLSSGMNENILPDHNYVVFDECHKLPGSIRSAMGKKITKFSVSNTAKLHASFFEESELEKDLKLLADKLDETLEKRHSEDNNSMIRLKDLDNTEPEIANILGLIEEGISSSQSKILKEMKSNSHLSKLQIKGDKALLVLEKIKEQLTGIRRSTTDPNKVIWIAKEKSAYSLNVADIKIDDFLQETLWDSAITAILCSATVPPNLTKELGLTAEKVFAESPFNYKEVAALYIPAGMPLGNDRENFFEATLEPIEELVRLTDGRTLLLFTSWKAMRDTYERMSEIFDGEFNLMMQGEKPKGALVEDFKKMDKACLFGTQSFWEGISIDGEDCVSVIIDKIPFSSPADPIFQAIREKAGDKAFFEVDIPHASVTLAQGVGRLIRTTEDKGLVTVLDARLAEKSYRKNILEVLPPLKRIRNKDKMRTFIEEKIC